MIDSALQTLLNEGEELLRSLEEETAACLRKVDAIAPDDLERFLERRQKLVSGLADFDTKLNGYLSHSPVPVPREELAFRRESQERLSGMLESIAQMERLVLALAGKKLLSLREEIRALSSGRRALHGYQSGNIRSSLHGFSG